MSATPAVPAPATPHGQRDRHAGVAGATVREPLREVLAGAVSDAVVTGAQAEEILRRYAAAEAAAALAGPGQDRARLAELAGYAGGSLALGAAGLFLATEWSALGDAARATALLVAALALAAGGAAIVLTSGRTPRELGARHDSARRRLVSVLWALAACALAGAVGVLSGDEPVLAASAAGLGAAVAGYALVRGAPGQLATAAAATAVVGAAVERVGDSPDTATPYAVAFVALAATWAGLAGARVLRERDLGFAVAAVLGVIGGQLPVLADGWHGLAYALTAAVAVAGYAGYAVTRSWPVLAGGVVATTLVVPEALHDWTKGSVSVAGAVFVAGLTLLAASAVGLRLRKAAG